MAVVTGVYPVRGSQYGWCKGWFMKANAVETDPSKTSISGRSRVSRKDARVTTIKLDKASAARLERLRKSVGGAATNSDVMRLSLQILEMARTGDLRNTDLALVSRDPENPEVSRYILPWDHEEFEEVLTDQ